MKKKKKSVEHFASDAVTAEEPEEKRSFSDEDLNQLYDAIKQLSEIDRAVILLYLDKRSQKEIAEIIGTNPNNIGVRVKRIKTRLKKLMDGKIN